MTVTRTRMLNVGDRIQYHGLGFGFGPTSDAILHANDGDIATVTEFHPAVPGTGRRLGYDDETGEPYYDEGDRAYVVAVFENGLHVAVDGLALESGRYTKVPS